jgi:hypothetical protein
VQSAPQGSLAICSLSEMQHQSAFKRIEQSLGRVSSVISVGYGLNESDDFCSSRKSDAVINGVLYSGMGRKFLEQ